MVLLGGVPSTLRKLCRIRNLKAAVIKACFYDLIGERRWFNQDDGPGTYGDVALGLGLAACMAANITAMGFVPLSKTGAELLFELISQRYEHPR